MGGIWWSKGSKANSLTLKVLTTTDFVILVTCVIYEGSEGSKKKCKIGITEEVYYTKQLAGLN